MDLTLITLNQQDDWDEHIDECLFAYRTKIHASMKYTPATMMFGQELRLPMDFDVPGLAATAAIGIDADDDEEILLKRMQQFIELNKMREEALSNSQSAQLKQKQRYDIKHAGTGPPLKVGDEVLVKDSRRQQRRGSKQQPLYIGPFLIKEITKGRALRLEGRKNVIAVSNVKRYNRTDQSQKSNQAIETGEHEEVNKVVEEAEAVKELDGEGGRIQNVTEDDEAVKYGDDEKEVEAIDEEEEEVEDLPLLDPVPKSVPKKWKMLSIQPDAVTVKEMEAIDSDEEVEDLPFLDPVPKSIPKKRKMLSIQPDAVTIEFVPVDRNWQKARAAALNFSVGKTVFAQPLPKTVGRFANPRETRPVRGMPFTCA